MFICYVMLGPGAAGQFIQLINFITNYKEINWPAYESQSLNQALSAEQNSLCSFFLPRKDFFWCI